MYQPSTIRVFSDLHSFDFIETSLTQFWAHLKIVYEDD